MLEPSKKRAIARKRSAAMRINWKRVLFWLLFLAFFGSLAYALFFSGFLAIRRISIIGAEKLDSEALRNEIGSRFSGKYFGFLPKDNLIFAAGSSIRRELEGRYRLISSVETERSFPDGLSIRISERHMRIILCSSGHCYCADENGNLLPVEDFSGEELDEEDYPVLNDDSGAEIDPDKDVIDPEYLGFISAIRSALQNRVGIMPEREMETPSRVSPDLRIMTDEGWRILFDSEIDPEKEISMLDLVLREKIGDQRSNLDYVDLRADNKVFYKFKDGTDGQEGDQEGQDDQSSSSSSRSADSKKKKD